jgi:hypothetical protein
VDRVAGPGPGPRVAQALQRPALDPAGAEGDPGQPPAGPGGAVAVFDGLLEQGRAVVEAALEAPVVLGVEPLAVARAAHRGPTLPAPGAGYGSGNPEKEAPVHVADMAHQVGASPLERVLPDVAEVVVRVAGGADDA